MPAPDDLGAIRATVRRQRQVQLQALFGGSCEAFSDLPCTCRIAHMGRLHVQRNEGRCRKPGIRGHGRSPTMPRGFARPPACGTGRPRHVLQRDEVQAIRCESQRGEASIQQAPWRPIGPGCGPRLVRLQAWRAFWPSGPVEWKWGHVHDVPPKRGQPHATWATKSWWTRATEVLPLDRGCRSVVVPEGQ